MSDHKTLSPTLKPPEYRRDEQGQFARPQGFTLRKAPKKKKAKNNPVERLPGAGPGRPKGSKNKTTLALKEMLLNSLEGVGGQAYFEKLAIENSSAYCSLLGKIVPHTLASAPESDGGPPVIRFERHIVFPGGHREIEGVTSKALPAPDPALPKPSGPTDDTNEGTA
jgi:hypothetical protein